MLFNPNIVNFGGHETFPVRYSWLSKGYKGIVEDKNFFKNDDVAQLLGVGANMSISIKYWLKAFKIIDHQNFQITTIGKKIFDFKNGYDPFLEDDSTIWLLHWLVCSNPRVTLFYFLFNKFHKFEFTSDEMLTDLTDFLAKCVAEKKRPSMNTLKKDVQMIIRMYSSQPDKNTSEDSIDSPLSSLNLFYRNSGEKRVRSRIDEQKNLPYNVLAFAIAELMESQNIKSIPLTELMYTNGNLCSIGSIFKLSENGLIAKIENITKEYPSFFQIRESSGINQLFKLKEIDPFFFLDRNYENLVKVA